MTEVSPNPTLRENQSSIRGLRKRSFLHGNAKEREIVSFGGCKNALQFNFGLQQVSAIGLSVGFREDSAMTPIMVRIENSTLVPGPKAVQRRCTLSGDRKS